MKLMAFTVLDKAVGAYLPPFFARSKGEALRSFMNAAADAKHQFAQHPSDFVLFYLGMFDDSAGLFLGVEPERLVSAQECLNVHARSDVAAPVLDSAEFGSSVQ